MQDRTRAIFGNEMSDADRRKAAASKAKYAKKFGDDSDRDYSVKLVRNATLFDPLGVCDLRVNEGEQGEAEFDREKGIIVGNIRMGFGHYRISIAMASAAHALGYTPYWMEHHLHQGDRRAERPLLDGLAPEPEEQAVQQAVLGADELRGLPEALLQRFRPEERGADGPGVPERAEGHPADRHPRLARPGRPPRRDAVRCERHPGQLANGPASGRGRDPHDPDPPELHGLPHPERDAGE